jgi:ribosomal protein S18 acetylase RimI-like enzyme
MESSIRYRHATAADVPGIVQMLADDALGATRERAVSPLPQSYYDAFQAIDADPNIELIVADAGGVIVGTLQLSFTPGLSRQGMWRATIEAVRVEGSQRGKGIGAAMIKDSIARARARGCGIVQLTSDKSREDAQRFYERLGFKRTHVGMKLSLQ